MSINEDNSPINRIPEPSFLEFVEIIEFLNKIKEQKFLLNETGITPRVFNSWKNLNLIPLEDTERRWNKFNFSEFLWLKIIQELREFGLSIDKILMVKAELFEYDFITDMFDLLEKEEKRESVLKLIDSQKQFTDEMRETLKQVLKSPELLLQLKTSGLNISLLDYMIFNSVIKRKNNGLVVFSSGECIPWFDDFYEIDKDSGIVLQRPHIFISFSTFIFNFLFDEKKENYISSLQILSKEELEILTLLKSNELKEIKIKFNDKSKPYMLEITSGKQVSTEEAKQIIKNMVFKNYQSINFKTNNNKTVYIENSQKKML